MVVAKTKNGKKDFQQEFGIAETIQQAKQKTQTEKKKSGSTRITIKYDVGFHNQLYIRGEGAGLNWDKGVPLKNVKADEWVWENAQSFTHCHFKVLINDQAFESGDNHQIANEESTSYTPHF